jgi:protein involved in polysaccharide export with SLBB domain
MKRHTDSLTHRTTTIPNYRDAQVNRTSRLIVSGVIALQALGAGLNAGAQTATTVTPSVAAPTTTAPGVSAPTSVNVAPSASTMTTPSTGASSGSVASPASATASTAAASTGGSGNSSSAPSTNSTAATGKGGTAEGTSAAPSNDAANNSSDASKNSTDANGTEGQVQSKAQRGNLEEVEFQRFVREATGRSLPLFGYELFSRGAFTANQGTAVPSSYVLGPGDELVVQSYGLVDFTERLVIDREGRVLIPKAGPLTLSGIPLGSAEKVLTAHLGRVYRNFTLTVTMGRVRSTEVLVVGQARNPGRHVVSGLSSLINALFETGGPSAQGSLRGIELRRAGKTITQVDLYRFLTQGDTSADVSLQPGDVIFIPPAGPRAALLGSVNASAIYELKAKETIDQVLGLSGGLPILATPLKAQLERVNPSKEVARYVEDFALDSAGIGRTLQAGDVLTIFQISPQIADVVTLQGNVASPMRYTWREGMKVADLVVSNNFLVPVRYWLDVNAGGSIGGLDRPEVNLEYATIQRLDPSRLKTSLIPFNLGKALKGDKSENLNLQPGDIVRVYGPTEAGPQTFDSVSLNAPFVGGAKRFVWRRGMTIRDAIPEGDWLREQLVKWVRSSGGAPLDGYATQELNTDYAVIRRLDPLGLRSELIAFNLGKAMQGDATENLKLEPGDQITLYGPNEAGAETLNSVTIRGEIVNGERRFIWRPGFSVKDIIPSSEWLVSRYNYWRRKSGQELRSDINWDYAQVVRRVNDTLQTQIINFNLGDAVLKGSAQHNVALQPGDRISLFTTRELAVPTEQRTRLVTLSGEVKVPGVYQVVPGETLSAVIKRAGGFTPQAHVFGLDFRRESTRVTQQQNLDRVIQRIETQVLSDTQTKLQNVTSAEQGQAMTAAVQADRLRLANLRNLKATGRVAFGLDPEKLVLPDMALEDGDTVNVPNRSAFVGVFGAVNNENSVLWRPGTTVDDVIQFAGTSTFADVSETYVLRADGTVLSGSQVNSWLNWGGIRRVKLQPGDTVVVPEKADRETGYTAFIRGAKDITAIFYQFGLGAAAVKTLRN